MKTRFLKQGFPAAALLAVGLACSGRAVGAGRAKSRVEPPETRIAAMIAQLGDEQYAIRQQAQEELARLGPEAFDALLAAEQSDDIEIAARATYLVNRIRIEWVRDSDSPAIKELLKNYDSQPEDVRRQCMQALADSQLDTGLAALCRLIRFERSPLLSKQGAMMILADSAPADSLSPRRAKIISDSLQGSTRPAAKWLLTYVRFHTDPEAALAQWDELVKRELAVSDGRAPQAEAKIRTVLLRRQAEMLLKRGHRERALAVMHEMIGRASDDVDSLSEFVEWLAKNKAWTAVDEVAQRFGRTIDGDPQLLYTLAEARRMQGNNVVAEQIAKRAFDLGPDFGDMTARLKIAAWLEESGLMAWCEREFRYIISHGTPLDSAEVSRARLALSEILHDQARDGEAAEVLRTLVDFLPHNAELQQRLTTLGHPPKTIRSRMYYFYACKFAANNDRVHQIEQLDLAKNSDPTDADVLIALYHLPEQSPQRRQETLALIHQAAAQFQGEINSVPNDYTAYNEYAWLIGNTEGDYDRAIEYARKAVELVPDEAGLLDTLGHCYAAKKDFVNAVKYQSRAAELEPYTRQITQARDAYRRALAASKPKKSPVE